MGLASYVQTSFLGGEWSETAQGQFDNPEYKKAMNVCLNGLPRAKGAWTRRPGFRLGGPTHLGLPARVIEYAFQESLPYTCEFTDSNLRFWNGVTLATTNDPQTIVSISTANPALVTTGTHGWSTGDTALITVLGTTDPLLLNRQLKLTKVSGTTFTIADAMTGTGIDGSLLQTFVSGTITRIQVVATPYGVGAWAALQSIQADQNAIIVHGQLAPQVLTPTVTTGDATFALTPANFIDGPYLDPLTNLAQVTPSALTGLIQLTVAFPAYVSTQAYAKGSYVTASSVNYVSLQDQNVGNTPASSATFWQPVSAASAIGPNGFVGSDIGRHVRLYSEPPLWVVGGSYVAGNVVKYNNSYWTSLATTTGALINAPGVSLTSWAVNATGALWTWGKITGLLNQISQSLSGAANIGDMTLAGGLTSAFDGNLVKTSSACAESVATGGATGSFVINSNTYIGRNFAGASDQKISSVTIFPPTNVGIISLSQSNCSIQSLNSVAITLYGSATLPANSTNGTVLGAVLVPIISPGAGFAPVTIPSSDTATAWKYVWVQIGASASFVGYVGGNADIIMNVCQMQLFNPPGTGTGSAVTAEILGPPLLYTTPITTWRLGLYSGTGGWPTCGTYHEGRLWLSGSVKNRVDGSQPNQVWGSSINFGPTLLDIGTVTAACAISYTFNSPDTNAIQWMFPDIAGIIAGTEKGEWLIQATALNQPLAPNNIQAHFVTRQGSSVVPTALPVRTEHTIVFIQRYARKIIEYFADIFSGKFTAPNIAEDAEHLSSTANSIVELAYQQNITPTIWARTSQGNLIGCAYQRTTLMSSQGPTAKGWHRHTLGSSRSITSLTSGPSPDGTLDTPVIVTAPTTATGVYHVCFMARIFEETETLLNASFLDEAMVPTSYTNTVLGGISSLVLTGLWPLNGKTCDVFAGGLDCGSWLVTNGQITIPLQGAAADNPLLTTTFISSFSGAMPALVGFSYTSQGQLLRPIMPPEAGTRAGPALGDTRRSHKINALLVNTQGISFGTSFTDAIGGTKSLNLAQLKSAGGTTLLAANQLFSGVYWQPLQDGYSLDSMLCWQITRPFPATIAAIGASLQTQDQ